MVSEFVPLSVPSGRVMVNIMKALHCAYSGSLLVGSYYRVPQLVTDRNLTARWKSMTLNQTLYWVPAITVLVHATVIWLLSTYKTLT